MARGVSVREDLCATLRAVGRTRRTVPELAAQMGVSRRTMNYAIARLQDDGLIALQWEGPTERTIVWVGPCSNDEADAGHRSRVPATA